jgi:hypothetical protein
MLPKPWPVWTHTKPQHFKAVSAIMNQNNHTNMFGMICFSPRLGVSMAIYYNIANFQRRSLHYLLSAHTPKAIANATPTIVMQQGHPPSASIVLIMFVYL